MAKERKEGGWQFWLKKRRRERSKKVEEGSESGSRLSREALLHLSVYSLCAHLLVKVVYSVVIVDLEDFINKNVTNLVTMISSTL